MENKPAKELNDAPVLNQMRGHEQKLLALLLWKIQGVGKPVNITLEDIKAYNERELTVLYHGHFDSIELALVTAEQAKVLAEFQKTKKGHA